MTASPLPLPLEKLEIRAMASGHRALLLSERVRWEEFPEYAERFVTALHGANTHRADAHDVRVWQVAIDGEPFYLSFDDYPGMLSLEARSSSASDLIDEIRWRLRWLRDGSLEADGPVRPYTRAELNRAVDGFPDRGERCHRCGALVPQFDELSSTDESRAHELIRSGRPTVAMQELVAATGCPTRWAKVWVAHDGRGEVRLPGPPCPRCGKPLRTSKAQQCPHCHADWHPPRGSAG